MGVPNVAFALRAPGRLSYGATSLATAYPHGGTALGLTRQVAVKQFGRYADITAEEFGSEVVDRLWTGDNWIMVAILESFDNDAIKNIFRNTVIGGTSSDRVVVHPQTVNPVRPGSSIATAAPLTPLVFTPLDMLLNPMVVFYRALPEVLSDMSMELGLDRNLHVAMRFTAIRNSAGRSVAIGKREDLSLTGPG